MTPHPRWRDRMKRELEEQEKKPMNIYRVNAEDWGYGANYAVVLLAETMDEAVELAFEHWLNREVYPGRKIGYRAKLIGVADEEFEGGDPEDVEMPGGPDSNPRLVLVANAGG